MKNFKQSIKIYFLVLIILPTTFFTTLYYYDPMQIFHKSYITKELHLHDSMRQQAAGIINNFEFDSIILGTSMLANTSSFEASKMLDANFINISLNGSDFYEREPVLKYALKNKKIKNVIYSLDRYYLEAKKSSRSDLYYLYDESKLNDFNVYLNSKFLMCAVVLSKKNKCIGSKKSFDKPTAWSNNKNDIERFGGIENWFNVQNNDRHKGVFKSIVNISYKIKNNEIIIPNDIEYNIKNTIEYIDEYLLKIVKEYKDTRFIFVFPPYYRMQYAHWKQFEIGNYQIHKAVVKYLTEQSYIYKNMEIYGYEDKDFLDDIANYKDLRHYHPDINSIMLQSFKDKTELLTLENVDNYIKVAENKAQNYNIFEISDKIEYYLNQ